MKIESEPHKLCIEAAKKVQQYILEHPEIRADADKGKMFGVLLVNGDTNDDRVHKHGEFAS